MAVKTNAVRMLDTAKISYELREYEVDENDVSAVHVAESLGIDPSTLYKTLVVKDGASGYYVAVIPGGAQLDLKKMARSAGVKKCEMVPVKDLLALTGYIRGGCSPIGMKKLFPTFVDQVAAEQEQLIISAGKRGLQLIMKPADLVRLVHAKYADLLTEE